MLVLQQLGGINGVLFYSSTIFESAGMPVALRTPYASCYIFYYFSFTFSCFHVLGVTSSNAATFGVGAIQVVATAISTWLVDKAGRRLLLTVSINSLLSYL